MGLTNQDYNDSETGLRASRWNARRSNYIIFFSLADMPFSVEDLPCSSYYTTASVDKTITIIIIIIIGLQIHNVQRLYFRFGRSRTKEYFHDPPITVMIILNYDWLETIYFPSYQCCLSVLRLEAVGVDTGTGTKSQPSKNKKRNLNRTITQIIKPKD